MIPPGLLTETFIAEARPTAERDDHGGLTAGQEWTKVRKFHGSYEAQAYIETEKRSKVQGSIQALVRCHFFPDITGDMRLRWVSRGNRVLYISAIIERANRTELEITVDEEVA